MNVGLRSLEADDAGWLDAWFPTWAGRFRYAAPNAEALMRRRGKDGTRRLYVIERDDEAAGLIVCRTAIAPALAMIELVATAPQDARRGSGMRAAELVEAHLRVAGATRIVAPTPESHGIAVYFWLRLGYRPLLQPEWPCHSEGIAWMAREFDAD